MAEITIMKIGSNLIVPIQVELHDVAAVRVQQDIMEAIEEKGARGLLIDISKLEVVDSFLGRLIGDTAAMARAMGTETVLAGLQPAVAITLMELGLNLGGVHTALDAEAGLEILNHLAGNKARGARVGENSRKTGGANER